MLDALFRGVHQQVKPGTRDSLPSDQNPILDYAGASYGDSMFLAVERRARRLWAAAVAARMGAQVALSSFTRDSVEATSCNPAIGGA
jgi:hypothetical protein